VDTLRLIPCLTPHGWLLLAPSDEGPEPREVEDEARERFRLSIILARCGESDRERRAAMP
jgi:hypothetical protein